MIKPQVMIRPLLLAAATFFWVGMMSLHLQREFFQLTPVRAPYEVLSILTDEIREEYRGIYLGDSLIGFVLTVLERKEPSGTMPPEGAYELRQNTYMTFLFLGHEREMLVRSRAYLNNRLELLSFDLKVTSGEYWTEMSGEVSGNLLATVIRGKEGAPVRKEIPVEKPLFFSESVSMIWTPENLKPGKKGRLHLWNPLLLGFEDIEFRVGRKTKIPHEGEEREAFLVHLTEQGLETRYWILPEGVVLRHESPMGLVMLKQEAWKIFERLREGRKHLTDLPNLYSIPSNRTFKNPEKLSMMRFKIKTPDGEKEMTLVRENLRDFMGFKRPVSAGEHGDLAPYLASTEFIQADAPAIVKTARTIAGDETSALEAGLKVMRWVHDWITPTPTLSIPSALQVLDVGKGDCNEYTALFTALARALGIPTKMIAGLVYQQGRFFYHAWPEVYVGKWIPLDPTFNQAPADVTHIPLVEGDLEEQVALIRKLGKIQIEILEAG